MKLKSIGFTPRRSVFLPEASLACKVLALFVLGAGPFACREWRSLSLLIVLTAVVGFARSPEGLLACGVSILLALLVFVAGTSTLLAQYPELAVWLVVFSAYGVGLYAIVLIAPHIRIADMLDSSRRFPRFVRRPLTWIVHVAAAFFQSEQGIVTSVRQVLRAAGIEIRLGAPVSLIAYPYWLLSALWLHTSHRAYGTAVAIRTRLEPRLMELPTATPNMSVQSAAVALLTIVAAFVVFQDFVIKLFK